MQNSDEALLILNLEAALAEVQEKYRSANAERVRWQGIETLWAQEINMISSLLRVRKSRFDAEQARIAEEQSKLALETPVLDAEDTVAESPDDDGSVPDDGDAAADAGDEVNRIQWAYEQVAKTGTVGISASELFAASQAANLPMHKNYPYVALGKLVERNRIEKRGTRYYPKSQANEEGRA